MLIAVARFRRVWDAAMSLVVESGQPAGLSVRLQVLRGRLKTLYNFRQWKPMVLLVSKILKVSPTLCSDLRLPHVVVRCLFPSFLAEGASAYGPCPAPMSLGSRPLTLALLP